MSSMLDIPAIRQAALAVTVEQYHRLGQTGVIPKKTELLRGVIIKKMIKSPLHSWLVQVLSDWLKARVPDGMHVRQEQPLTFADSEPEPDLAVVSGSPDDYRFAHPTTATLVIEVAVSSAEMDRAKADLYAVAGVCEYLIVLPEESCVELYTSPETTEYSVVRTVGRGRVLNLTSLPGVQLELDRIFRH